jgi:hypothetical protein
MNAWIHNNRECCSCFIACLYEISLQKILSRYQFHHEVHSIFYFLKLQKYRNVKNQAQSVNTAEKR